MSHRYIVCAAAQILLLLGGCETPSGSANDPMEMERAWNAALVRIPTLGGKYDIDFTMEQQFHRHNYGEIEGEWPTVIYMHGCEGFWSGTYRRMRFLTKGGYAVIAPNSFARQFYPKVCDGDSYTGGFYRPSLGIQQADAGYAIARAKTLGWVDEDNVFLMGHSQGGTTTATFSSGDPDKSVKARVIEGWTCNSPWSEYKGINAPESEPVLSLVGGNDPWFENIYNKGDCGSFMNGSNGSESIVYRTGLMKNRHELLENWDAQQIVLRFLRAHTD